MKFKKDWFPLTESAFLKGMKGHFVRRKHKGFVALLYHTGVRCSEGLRAVKEQFQYNEEVDTILFDVGKRLKGGFHTAPLPIPLKKPYANEILWCMDITKKGKRVWPYCRKTGYNIVHRVLNYPHHLRLSRITMLVRSGFTIDQVRSWTGHAQISSLQPYVGFSDITEMGEF